MNTMTAIDKTPHNIELEQQIIGAVLVNNDLFHRMGALRTEHFFDPVHAEIWRNIAGRITKDHLASPVTLKSDFAGHEGLQELGGTAYIARMAGVAASSYALGDYVRELIDVAGRRHILQSLKGTIERLEAGQGAADARSEIELFLHEQEAASDTPRSMSLLAAHTKAVEQMHERSLSGEVSLTTGLKSLDDLTGGLHKGELTLIAGSTSMGKSAVGAWLAYTAAKVPYMVGFASLEMSETALSTRIGSIDSGVPYQAVRNTVSEATMRSVIDGVKAQQNLPIYIYSDKVRDVPSILSETKRLQRLHPANGQYKGLGLLVIDYVQLVRGKGSNSLEVLSRVSMDLKLIAKMLDIPVVALAQVDRSLSKRDNPIPFLSDLRGSGDLEFAADNVIFCHRPEYYIERQLQIGVKDTEERADLEAAMASTRGKMDLIVAKQRMGQIGQCRVNADLGLNRFWDLEDSQQEIEF